MKPRCKTALMTGGMDGIGKEVARGLARSGYAVIVVGRDAEKGEQGQTSQHWPTQRMFVVREDQAAHAARKNKRRITMKSKVQR